MQSPRFHTRVCLINAFVSGLSRIRVDLVLTERFKLANSPVFFFFTLFFIAKNVEIYKHREQDINIFLQRTIIQIKIKTNILGLRTSNYGIICTEKCKNKIT